MPLWAGTKQQGDASDVTAAGYIMLLSLFKKRDLCLLSVYFSVVICRGIDLCGFFPPRRMMRV